MSLPEFSPYFVTVPLGLGMFAYLLYRDWVRPKEDTTGGGIGTMPERMKPWDSRERAAPSPPQQSKESDRNAEIYKQKLANPRLFLPRPPITASGVAFKTHQSQSTLVFHLTNTRSPTPLKNCQVWIDDFKIWSDGLKQFSVVREFAESNGLLPMRIFGPSNLYADDPAVCYFIESSDNEALCIKSLEPQRKILLPKKGGVWCAYIRLQVDGLEFFQRVCFRWVVRQHLEFIQCPDYSLIDFV